VAAVDLFVVDGGTDSRVTVEPFLKRTYPIERGTVCAAAEFGLIGGVAQRDSAGEHMVESISCVHREPSGAALGDPV